MAKKPTLTLVSPKPNSRAPPPNLGEAGAALWHSIQAEFRVDDAPGIASLMQICVTADRVAEYSEVIARDGAVIRTKTGLRDHPLLKHELAARSFICRALHRLGFDIEPNRDTVGRPPGVFPRPKP